MVGKRFVYSLILALVFGLVTIGGLTFFYFSLRSELDATKKSLEQVKEEKAKVDTELAVLKNTDLAKEVEILKIKLNISQRDLAQKGQDLASANNRLKTIEANRGKITSQLDAIEAVSSNYWKYTLTDPILDNIESKIKALGDSEILSLWTVARNQTTPNSANPSAVWDVVSRILANVRNLLP